MGCDIPDCDCCFMECPANPRRVGHESPYPCTKEMREWAKAHRNEPGDALGFVFEEVASDRRRA